MRVLLTGALGFVGPHLGDALREVIGPAAEVIATSRSGGWHPSLGEVSALDVTDEAAVTEALRRHAPTHIVHLAAIAAPTAASSDPEAAWRVHVLGTLGLARAILRTAPGCWLLHVGSGLIYGESALAREPLTEQALLAPLDDYAVTKAAADLALGALARRGLRCIRLRPFNHTGAGQSEAFAVPAFAMQIARIEAGIAPPRLRVGNLEAERDFLDVRDVARAYALAVAHSTDLPNGIILNIASGVPRRIGNVLRHLLTLSRARIVVEQDPARMRPSDLPRVVGDADRARQLLGWEPAHPFADTMAAVMTDCRARVAASQAGTRR